MAVIDVVTFNGEYDLFEIRYQILKDYVDEFIVVEFDKTFSGKDKPSYIKESASYFFDPIHTWENVNCYTVNEDHWSQYLEMARESPNTVGAEHWKREFAMKESIKDCLTHLDDDDIVYIGDCDEIWSVVLDPHDKAYKLNLMVYTYYLNQRSSEQFWGTLLARYGTIKGQCLNHLRSDSPKLQTILGWHFTSMRHALAKKLQDSYTEETYASPSVMANLFYNVINDRDFLGRDFRYWVDESDWPQYLTENREKYINMLK